MALRRLARFFASAPLAAILVPSAGTAASFHPGYGPCSITAAVRDRAGHPVAGAVVVVTGPTSRSASTSQAGIVSFVALPAGNYALRASEGRESSSVETISVTSGTGGVADLSHSLKFLALELEPASVGTALSQRGVSLVRLRPADPVPAFVLVALPLIDAGALGSRGSVKAAGGAARTLRERLDDIPLPDALRGTLALTGASALAQTVVVVPGAGTLGADPSPGTGGTLDLLTIPAGERSGAGGVLGTGSGGLNAYVAADDRLGPLTAAVRAEHAPFGDVARTFGARLALSSATVIDAQAFRLDDSSGSPEDSDAVEARAVGISTSLGLGQLGARTYESRFDLPGFSTADRLHGIALQFDGSLGPTGLSVSYVRNAESEAVAGREVASSIESRLGYRTVYTVAPAVRLEVSVARENGSLIGDGRDLGSTIDLRLAPTWRLDLSAASGVSPAPLDVVARAPFASTATPSSASERSATLIDTGASNTLAFEAYDRNETDRFAARANARVTGATITLTRAPFVGIGFELSSAFAHVVLSGPFTPERDALTTPLAAALGFTDASNEVAAFRAHAGMTYRWRSGVSVSAATTYLDAPNALAPTALVLGEAGFHVPLGRGPAPFALRLDAHDVLGGPLAPGQTPSERSLTSNERRTFAISLERPLAP